MLESDGHVTNATTAISPFAYLSPRDQFLIANAQTLLSFLLSSGVTSRQRYPLGVIIFPGTSQASPTFAGGLALFDPSIVADNTAALVASVNAILGTTLDVATVLALIKTINGGALLVDVSARLVALLDSYDPLNVTSVQILDPAAPTAPSTLSTAIAGGQYGQDTSCTDILRPGVLVSGVMLIAEACYRRLITTKGSLEYDPTYGYSLIDLLQRAMLPDEIAAIPRNVRAELLKDDRIDDVTVDSSYDVGSASLSLTVRGTASDGTSFALVMNASQVSVQLVSINDTTGAA